MAELSPEERLENLRTYVASKTGQDLDLTEGIKELAKGSGSSKWNDGYNGDLSAVGDASLNLDSGAGNWRNTYSYFTFDLSTPVSQSETNSFELDYFITPGKNYNETFIQYVVQGSTTTNFPQLQFVWGNPSIIYVNASGQKKTVYFTMSGGVFKVVAGNEYQVRFAKQGYTFTLSIYENGTLINTGSLTIEDGIQGTTQKLTFNYPREMTGTTNIGKYRFIADGVQLLGGT